MKKFTIFSIAAVCYALTLSCTDSILNRPADTPDESSVTKSSPEVPLAQNSTPMVLGEKLNNPYALEVMQAAVESLTPADKPVPTLMVTDLYVRFLPKDSTELAILYDVEKLELFDYPLDYEIMVEGDYYHDPSIPEGNPTWLYTTVAPDYEFPDVEYEILETCYIPQEVSVKSSSSVTFSPEDLEREAYRLAGLDSMWIDGPLTRAAEYPSGKFTVYDTETQEYVPVKGVKIRVHNIIKWATAYTDQNGCYTIGKKYRTNVHYAMVFKNTKGFKVWGNWAMLAPANHNMRFHSNSGYSDDFGTSSNAWDWATVNNAAYDYYNLCSQNGISAPPQNLSIWCYRNYDAGGMAWMIPRFEHLSLNINIYDLLQFHVGISLGILRNILPDIFIFPGNQKSSPDLYETTIHELSHASHFSVVGTNYWNKYMNYIANSYLNYKSPYASENIEHSGICAVGEMWGYAMGYIYKYEKYKCSVNQQDIYPGDSYFFKPHILWDIYKYRLLDKGEIFSCMTSDADEVYKLRNKIDRLFPNKAAYIDLIFAKYDDDLYDEKYEWYVRNDTDEPIYVFMSGGFSDLLSYTTVSRPDFGNKPDITVLPKGHLLQPGDETMLVSLVYHSGDTGNFNDIVNHNSVSVYSLILADKFGKIFHSPILNEELKNNPDFGSWKETTNSKTTKWTFICNRTEPIFSN